MVLPPKRVNEAYPKRHLDELSFGWTVENTARTKDYASPGLQCSLRGNDQPSFRAPFNLSWLVVVSTSAMADELSLLVRLPLPPRYLKRFDATRCLLP